MSLTDCISPIPFTPFTPFTPITIRESVFDFDLVSDFEPDDNNTLTPLLRRITASPKLLTPKDAAFTATTPTIINGRLAPPQQHYSKTPQRRGSPLVGLRRRLRSPDMRRLSTRVDVPTQSDFDAGNKKVKKSSSKSGNLAGRRRCRQLRLQELQRRYAAPFEIHAVPKPLSPRVAYLLRRVGMIRYRSLFQMEEVDYVVFCTLTKNDLQTLGVREADDREEIYRAVLMADLLVRERF